MAAAGGSGIPTSWSNSPRRSPAPAMTDAVPGLNHLAFHVGDVARLDELVAVAPDHGWTLMFADRHPLAGGADHCAGYLENSDGFEIELVASRDGASLPSALSRRSRARELGIAPGRYRPGPLNSMTDVAGVRVGQTTVIEGTSVRTGVTAVVPVKVGPVGGQLPAGFFVGNGYGKLIGATQIAELGVIETPIVLTGTLSAFRAADALVSYVLGLPGNEDVLSVNPVVGETNDGFLSDIRARPITEEHVLAALSGATDGPVAEGSVGAGTGTAALGFKAGIGTSSRVVRLADGEPCVIGVLVQANFSGTLSVLGVRIDHATALASSAREPQESERSDPGARAGGRAPGGDGMPGGDVVEEGNSCMIVVAVDRALDARQLARVARRAIFGMGRTGSDFAGTSGDYAIAFTTAEGTPAADSLLGPVFAAVQEAVEEAILNSVFMATTTAGYLGHTKYAVPTDYVARACRAAGVLGR